MAAPLILACLWVLAATVVAFLPMRRQFAPGLALLPPSARLPAEARQGAGDVSPALIAAMAWLTLANVVAVTPSRRKHWPAAYVLIALGLPILGWLAVSVAWWVTALVFLGACSVLRWPVRYALRWINARTGLRLPGAAE